MPLATEDLRANGGLNKSNSWSSATRSHDIDLKVKDRAIQFQVM